jgi:signal transduction histidine kinase
MRCSAGRLLVDVENEGEPALVGSPAAGGGNGLRGMRERIESCGGTLRSGPRPGGGFAVHAELPLAEVSA